MIRTIQQLPIRSRSRPMTQLINILDTRGRDAAIQWARSNLALWLSQNANAEILPGMTITQFVVQDGATSLATYTHQMSKPNEWIDTPMLYAAAGFFKMRIPILYTPTLSS